jgi:hypothetical protein
MGAPHGLDQALAAVCGGVCAIPVVVFARQAEGLDTATGQADGEEWLGWVQDLCEEVCRQRQGAEILQHREAGVELSGVCGNGPAVSAHVVRRQFHN